MKLRFGQRANVFFRGKENYAVCVANMLIDHLERRNKEGKTYIQGIGLGAGNARAIGCDAVRVHWRERKRVDGVYSLRPRLTVTDMRGEHPQREWFHPEDYEVQAEAAAYVLKIWESRDINFKLEEPVPVVEPQQATIQIKYSDKDPENPFNAEDIDAVREQVKECFGPGTRVVDMERQNHKWMKVTVEAVVLHEMTVKYLQGFVAGALHARGKTEWVS